MYKRIFIHALFAAVLAAIAALIYDRIYFFATQVDFSSIVNVYTIFGSSILVCMICSFIFYGLLNWLKDKGETLFNFIFSIVSFTGILLPLGMSLPLEVKSPELFPGLAVPMVFFPALAWFTIRPLFSHSA
ncbi:hypothetical protein [Flavihumibacter fluvii]|uniref:hypothetical protein n=1 Tax=Flavihumibacter fluvii TaxID=2838157 RepID=UPI001BDE97A8|nr:hypothetical protein [Flavihumibacter fluvii]ULQ53607.1 hypothetical protein KJS93_04640 [Flavihumibacter fluvii]